VPGTQQFRPLSATEVVTNYLWRISLDRDLRGEGGRNRLGGPFRGVVIEEEHLEPDIGRTDPVARIEISLRPVRPVQSWSFRKSELRKGAGGVFFLRLRIGL
jgi:hypothetical protein